VQAVYHSVNEGQIMSTRARRQAHYSFRMRRQDVKTKRRKQNVQGKSEGRNKLTI
jgi:hypothetical protein